MQMLRPYLLPLVVLLVSSITAFSMSHAEPAAVDGFLSSDPPPFGHAMRRLFHLPDGFLNFNHGSFGSTPIPVLEAQRALATEMEQRPDAWFRGGYQAKLNAVRARLAKYLGGEAKDLVLVENASVGVNAVLRSLVPVWAQEAKEQEGVENVVVLLSEAYSMVPKTLTWMQDKQMFRSLRIEMIPTTIPVQSDDEIVQALETGISNIMQTRPKARIRMALFSHIASIPPVVLPVERMAAVCKALGIPVFVDGAHALGHIPINLTDLAAHGVDMWVGNAHKWLHTPKSAAVMWVRAPAEGEEAVSWQKVVRPTVISSAYSDDFQTAFEYTGTRDYTVFCAMQAALDFRQYIGGDAAANGYMSGLARDAGRILSAMWGTRTAAPESMTANMVSVQLPLSDFATATRLQKELDKDHDMYIVVFATPLPITPALPGEGGKPAGDGETVIWCRLSAQIYLEIGDFKKLGETVLRLLQGYKNEPKLELTQ